MKTVAVLLSSYNGEKYLETQLESLFAQSGVSVSVLVRDDGSSDGTKTILQTYAEKGLLRWYEGENLGPAKSFLRLLCDAPQADYYAFCDQDDVWLSDKLERAVEKLEKQAPDKPALYFGNTRLADEKLVPIKDADIKGAYSFAQSLIRNNAVGCTMVINDALRKRANAYTPPRVDMHDHWLYMLCLALEGSVCFDAEPHILYRQHGDNAVGAQQSAAEERKRHLGSMLSGSRIRSRMACELLEGYGKIISEQNRLLLEKAAYYSESFSNKLSFLRESAFRHGDGADRNYLISALLGRF